MSDNHNDHQSSNQQHKDHSKKHMTLMMLCCILPIIAIAAIAAIFPQAFYVNFLFFLICPIMMLAMMIPNLLSKKKRTSESCH